MKQLSQKGERRRRGPGGRKPLDGAPGCALGRAEEPPPTGSGCPFKAPQAGSESRPPSRHRPGPPPPRVGLRRLPAALRGVLRVAGALTRAAGSWDPARGGRAFRAGVPPGTRADEAPQFPPQPAARPGSHGPLPLSPASLPPLRGRRSAALMREGFGFRLSLGLRRSHPPGLCPRGAAAPVQRQKGLFGSARVTPGRVG